MSYRIGQGYDIHQLKSGLPLIIGGVNITHSKGILAHSDGDILIHAIIDSLLGASNLGDLGTHFPATDDWNDASGLYLLECINKLILKKFPEFKIFNIDSTIILETPRLSHYIHDMKLNISNILNINIDTISIKATTTDKLGPIGIEQGIAVQSICLIQLD